MCYYTMKLIVGLGNPGTKYSKNRHNIGFLLIEKLASDRWCEDFTLDKKFHGFVTQGRVEWEKVILLKPTTYMNRSGTSIASIVSYYDIPTEDILILHDEIDLPIAQIKIKQGWGHAGHNGLRDTITHLWSKDFWRIRIWVDRPASKEMVANYVLSNFPTHERLDILDQYDTIQTHCIDFVTQKKS